MTQEEFLQKISEAKDIMEISNLILSLYLEKESLEQRNTELEQRIKELEEPKTCDGCIHEKQSSPLFIYCLGCNRVKHLKDKFHDINEPCKE